MKPGRQAAGRARAAAEGRRFSNDARRQEGARGGWSSANQSSLDCRSRPGRPNDCRQACLWRGHTLRRNKRAVSRHIWVGVKTSGPADHSRVVRSWRGRGVRRSAPAAAGENMEIPPLEQALNPELYGNVSTCLVARRLQALQLRGAARELRKVAASDGMDAVGTKSLDAASASDARASAINETSRVMGPHKTRTGDGLLRNRLAGRAARRCQAARSRLGRSVRAHREGPQRRKEASRGWKGTGDVRDHVRKALLGIGLGPGSTAADGPGYDVSSLRR